jgi:phosphatidylserine decarboxylase
MPLSPSRVAAETLRVLPRKGLSRVLGRLADVPAPASLLDRAMRAYVRAYDIDMSDYVVPDGGFRTFDDFFTRRLKPGARVVDTDPDVLVSPADGRLEDIGPIDLGATCRVKGRLYEIGELLGETVDAARFDGGQYFIVYLSPRDYHRVHAPVTGRVTQLRHVGGTLFPVNAIGLTHVPRLFARNERVVVHQHDERHGEVVSIMVGAIGVGRIEMSFDDLKTNVGRSRGGVRRYDNGETRLERGGELGIFHLGSTVIVITRPEARLRPVRNPGDMVRMGEAIAKRTG